MIVTIILVGLVATKNNLDSADKQTARYQETLLAMCCSGMISRKSRFPLLYILPKGLPHNLAGSIAAHVVIDNYHYP